MYFLGNKIIMFVALFPQLNVVALIPNIHNNMAFVKRVS